MFNIRLATLQDISNIQQCIQRNLPIYYSTLELYNLYYSGSKIIVITSNNNIIGCLIGDLNDDRFYISSLSIDKEYRRLNLATTLMNNLTYNKIELHVKANNIIAINFYKKNNFTVIKLIDNYYSNLDCNDAYLMQRIIN